MDPQVCKSLQEVRNQYLYQSHWGVAVVVVHILLMTEIDRTSIPIKNRCGSTSDTLTITGPYIDVLICNLPYKMHIENVLTKNKLLLLFHICWLEHKQQYSFFSTK